MPWVDPEQNAEFFNVAGSGPLAQSSIVQDAAPPTSIGPTSNYASGVIVSNGYKIIAIGVTSSQAGAVNIQRYLNREGTVAATASASTVALTAATPAVLVLNSNTDGIPFASFTIQITNTSGSTAAITNFYCLLQAT